MQHLTIDLGRVYNMTAVATQGKANTKEYVSGYYLLISDGGDYWRMAYSDSEGYEQAFTLLLTLYYFCFYCFCFSVLFASFSRWKY